MNRPILYAAPLFFAVGLWQSGALAQPAPPKVPTPSTYSLTELERFLGGRTLVTLDLKDATLEEVAAALSQASGQKITAESLPPMRMPGAVDIPPAPLFTLSATQTPFWEALRGWQIAARRAAEKAKALDTPVTNSPMWSSNVPNSVGIRRDRTRSMLRFDNSLADGRAVAAWPFLLIAADLERTQKARLSETGLRELELPPISPFSRVAGANAPAATPLTTQTPVVEEKRWRDRLVLNAYTLADPKVTPIALRYEVTEAIDDKGNDLRLPVTEDVRQGFSGSYQDFRARPPIQIMLASKPDMGKRLVRLRGVLHFSVVTRVKHWETTQLQTPVEDTIQQDGGGFTVRFKGVKKGSKNNNLNEWEADFAAQSRGEHLERFWRNRIESRGSNNGGSGILDFAGVPQMRLVDENGQEFEVGGISSAFSLGSDNPQTGVTTPASISIDVSPVPPDAAQNWKYTEERGFGFRAPFAWTPGEAITMGRPAKLIVDFPIERREISVPFEFTDLPLPPA